MERNPPVSNQSNTQNLYEVLGLVPGASDTDIRAAYKHLILQYHPDKSQNEETSAHFHAIQEAYETLRDPIKRAAYDQKLASTADREPRPWGPQHGGSEHFVRTPQENPQPPGRSNWTQYEAIPIHSIGPIDFSGRSRRRVVTVDELLAPSARQVLAAQHRERLEAFTAEIRRIREIWRVQELLRAEAESGVGAGVPADASMAR
ncbi:DnaJ-domain-containing protein [Viridothelium virens]|uniref:DnaJ-domain-containing protein n=1 Tax=Viridothelium virens TaxID=1048519 RepID=A0A6A6HPQ4_VIRVR|nr:DnaJ-domain-containing protein [Viridothelium virens]